MFSDVTMHSPIEIRRCFEGTYSLYLQLLAAFFLLVAWLSYLENEDRGSGSSETSVNFYSGYTASRPGNRSENLKPNKTHMTEHPPLIYVSGWHRFSSIGSCLRKR
jgi:hypothetical protein